MVTDENVTELRVTSAHTVIHYDIPNSQTKFGNRLALMLEHFYDTFDDAESKVGVVIYTHTHTCTHTRSLFLLNFSVSYDLWPLKILVSSSEVTY